MMRRNLLTARGRGRRTGITVLLTSIASLLVAASSAQAVVIDMGSPGNTSVPYNMLSQSNYVGVRLMPPMASQLSTLSTLKIPVVTSSAPCTDPALTSDFTLPPAGLCWHGGPVIQKNETFSFSWAPNPFNAFTAPFVEQFLRDVADGSYSNAGANPFTSPFDVTSQYTDGRGGRAMNNSLFSGGYDDQHAYPANGCPVSGTHYFAKFGNGFSFINNTVCLTDAQIQGELASLVVQNNVSGHTQPGYVPLLVVQTPPGVEVCMDAAAHLCSANSSSTQVPNSNPPVVPAQFCSYHSQVNVAGTMYPYVVQPYTVELNTPPTGCDEPDVPPFPDPITPDQVVTYSGERLVSPLSQSMIAAIVNPSFNGWFALNGSEINDNRCGMLAKGLDSETVGPHSYLLQREFNNGGILTDDPYAFQCAPNVTLDPNFVVPSPINQGDVIEFDGSKPKSMLLVPSAGFTWDFGDGTTATGPSQLHSYAKGGTYTVKLTVTDRGANTATFSQPVTVRGSDGQPVNPTPPPTSPTTPRLTIRLQLVPQSLQTMLKSGITIHVTTNMKAAGIVTLSIPRSAALKAHIKAGRGASVMIGRGTVSSIKPPTMSLRLKLAKATVAKLKRLSHLTMTVRLQLVAATGDRQAVVAAARY